MAQSDGDRGSEPDNFLEVEEPLRALALEESQVGDSKKATEADPSNPPSAPSNEWSTGISVAAHLAALQAKHEAELQAAVLREQVKRLEVEKQLVAAQLSVATGSGKSTASEGSTTSSNSRADRRRREQEWDKLQYVPVGNYEKNPFRGPDPSVHLGNRDRPQPFLLEHDPVYQELKKQRNSMRYEYEIHAPMLHYLWGINEFVKQDFKALALNDTSPEERAPYVDALENSLARTLEWLSIRHALISERARSLAEGETNSPIIQHLQDEVYAFVGSAPPTSTWLDEIHTTFRDKVSVQQLKALATTHGNAKGGKSGASSSGVGGGSSYKKGGKKVFPPLSNAGKSDVGGKEK